ncbi:IS3 family transposase, partial [Intestinibacter sp.]
DNYMDYYNNFRYQWNLKKLTPVQYRNQLLLSA